MTARTYLTSDSVELSQNAAPFAPGTLHDGTPAEKLTGLFSAYGGPLSPGALKDMGGTIGSTIGSVANAFAGFNRITALTRAEIEDDQAFAKRPRKPLGPFDFKGETALTPPPRIATLGEARLTAAELTREPIAPFYAGQRIALAGGRLATVVTVRRNRAQGTPAFGAWMVEARPEGINPDTGAAHSVDTFFARECHPLPAGQS